MGSLSGINRMIETFTGEKTLYLLSYTRLSKSDIRLASLISLSGVGTHPSVPRDHWGRAPLLLPSSRTSVKALPVSGA